MLLMSFVCAYIYVALKLRKQGIIKRYIFYMMMLNTVLILYFGLVYTVVTQTDTGKWHKRIGIFKSRGHDGNDAQGCLYFQRYHLTVKPPCSGKT